MDKYKKMKVFDCQDMSKEVRKVFFETTEKGNDCYIDWYTYDEQKPVELVDPDKCSYKDKLKLDPYNGNEIISEEILSGVKYIREKGDDIVSDWLCENGAEIGEKVIIKHWW